MSPSQPTRTAVSRRRVLRPAWPLDLAATLGTLRRGAGDPTHRIVSRDEVHLAGCGAAGPFALELRMSGGELTARAWGGPESVAWVLEGVPELVGWDDRPQDLHPRHGVLARAHARWSPRVRVLRTRRVWDALLPAVIEQKVTGQEAFAGYRRLVRQHGRPAPGPLGERGLLVPPGPQEVAAVPSWTWLRCGIDPARSDTLQRAVAVAHRLDRLHEVAPRGDRAALDAAHGALRRVPGIGAWTAAEVAQRALGDPDAVSWRDYHVAGHVTHALTGQEGDDVAMARVLAPYAGQRYRVQLLLSLPGTPQRQRRGPRMAPRGHLPVR